MLNNLKALVVVLFLAIAVFRVVRPLCLRFMTLAAFERRRNAWLGLTALAFISPSFWTFAVGEFLVLIWLVQKDENPLALFALLTFVIPPAISFYIPAPLINQFFPLTQYRILALVLLVTAIVRYGARPPEGMLKRFGLVDLLMLVFVVIQLILLIPYESFTNTLRRGLLVTLDTYLIIYAFQRLKSNKEISEVLASFWVSTAIMAPIAIFESFKSWLMYSGLGDLWGDPIMFAYLFRGDSLRAQAAGGHSIILGYELAAGLGVFLYLQRADVPRLMGWLVAAVFSAALISTGSRGGWITAMIAALVFFCFRPNAGRRLAAVALGTVLVFALLYASPLKESVIDRLPIIGHVDQDTIEYRQRLFEVSWLLIKQNPIFADPFVAGRMESLRQGQGIIDIVNGYIYIALFNGLVALALVVGSFVAVLSRGLRVVFAARRVDEDAATLGVVLLSVVIASLFYIATGPLLPTHYLFLGLLCSYWSINARRLAKTAPAKAHKQHVNPLVNRTT